jgi:threonine dehydratase
LSLTNEQKNKGVIAVSTGNHGKGVAHAAKQIGIKSTIFMSSMVPEHRKKAIESLGAKVEIIGNNSDEADLYAREFAKKNNITLVHPFDDLDVIAGQGTVGLEMLEAMPDIDSVIIPTSGGGLIGGIALAIKLQKPNVKIIATSMKKGPSMYESLKAGKPVDVKEEETLADCLGGSIGLENQYTFGICKDVIDDFILIDEPKIAEGIKFNFEKHKLVTEGAAATSIMAVKDQLSSHFGKNTICLLCGGNIDSELFGKIIS